jgi:hypothetical protein
MSGSTDGASVGLAAGIKMNYKTTARLSAYIGRRGWLIIATGTALKEMLGLC